MGGVPLAGFVGFFDVDYGVGSSPGEMGEEEAKRRKLERWGRVKEVC